MPKAVGKSNDGVTFIVGDPRSKQNLSKIRRHASKAPKSDTRAVTPPDISKRSPSSSTGTPNSQASADECSPLPETERIETPPAPGYLSTFRLPSADDSQRTFFEHAMLRGWNSSLPQVGQGAVIDTAAARYHLIEASSKSNLVASEQPIPSAWNGIPTPGPGRCTPSPPTSQHQESGVLPLRPVRRSMSFTTVGTSLGTWYEKHPSMQAAATFDHDFDPHKRARLSRRDDSGDTPDALLSEKRNSDLVLPQEPPDGRTFQGSRTSTLIRQRSSLDLLRPGADNSRLRKRKSALLHRQWRVGAAPSRPLALSATHTSFEHLLLRTDAYYTSRFESTWQPMIMRNSQALESDGRTAAFYECNLSIAALIEAGRPAFANLVIQRNLSVIEELLQSEQPRLYHMFSIMALDPTASVLGQFHRKFVKAIIPLAQKVLGNNHPCTMLLQCHNLPSDTKARLREALQRRIHELHLATFGDVYLTHEGVFIGARVLAQLGQIEEALSVLAWLKPRFEGTHGMNSMLAVWVLLEQANICLGAGQADVRTELMLSDALRRLKVLEVSGRHLPENERSEHLKGLAHLQVGGLRALGRMHVMRKNYAAALESYRQAMNLGRERYGSDAPSTELAQGDLDRARASGIEPWTVHYAPPDETEEEIEMVETVLGEIVRSKAAFGREAVKVPVDKAPVYGLVPYEDSKWREGIGAS